MQTMVECDTELAIISEPYRVPDHPDWLGDKFGTIFIIRGGSSNASPLLAHVQEHGFIIATWSELVVAGVYASPSWPLSVYKKFLDELIDNAVLFTN